MAKFINDNEYQCDRCGDRLPKTQECQCSHPQPAQPTVRSDNPDFIKFDTGKPLMSLVEPAFVQGVANILTIGAQKYAPNNWKLLPPEDIYRYKDSTLRHLYAYLSGELYDPETGEPHLDHIATNIMFLRYYEHQLPKDS